MRQFSKPKTQTLYDASAAGTGSWFMVDAYMDTRTVIIDLTAGDTITLEISCDENATPTTFTKVYTSDTIEVLYGPFVRIRAIKTGTTGTAKVILFG